MFAFPNLSNSEHGYFKFLMQFYIWWQFWFLVLFQRRFSNTELRNPFQYWRRRRMEELLEIISWCKLWLRALVFEILDKWHPMFVATRPRLMVNLMLQSPSIDKNLSTLLLILCNKILTPTKRSLYIQKSDRQIQTFDSSHLAHQYIYTCRSFSSSMFQKVHLFYYLEFFWKDVDVEGCISGIR